MRVKERYLVHRVPVTVVVPVAVDVDPALVDVEATPVVVVDEVAVPVVDVAVDPVDDSPDDVELVDDDSEDVSVVSAAAKPGEEMTITPIPNAAAKAPTRPI